MVYFICQLQKTNVSVRTFQEEISIWIGELSKSRWPFPRNMAMIQYLKVGIEKAEEQISSLDLNWEMGIPGLIPSDHTQSPAFRFRLY